MAENPSGPTEPLDVQRVHSLVRLMKRYDLTALDITDGSLQIRLRRQRPQVAPPSTAGASYSIEPAAPNPVAATGSAAAGAESPPTTVSTAPRTIVIESPMVGTYFASSAPESPSFVSIGSVVHPDSIVCIIEAMKVFTDIPAGVAGTIAAMLVKNGQSVEFGQPLFRVIPA